MLCIKMNRKVLNSIALIIMTYFVSGNSSYDFLAVNIRDNLNLGFSGVDEKTLAPEAPAQNISFCSGCSGHGICDETFLIPTTNPHYFSEGCICNIGYAGTYCEKDNDACATNPCPSMTSCVDIPASEEQITGLSYTCIDCSVSSLLNANTTKCKACTCNNTAGCSEITGICTCRPGWTGTSCEADVNECLNASYCNLGEECHNLNGSAECICTPGFRKLTPVAACQVCNGTHYGDNCSTPCTCVKGQAVDCNETNGVCTCARGWTGTNCEIDIDECISPNYCPDPHETCYNLNGSVDCRCNQGFVKHKSTKTCQACDATHYGTNCTYTCLCVMDNTNDCSDTDGTCSCKSGWTGIDCGTDVNECLDTSHCGPLEDCYNTNGAAECRCKPGYENITADGGCQECNATHYGVNCLLPCNCIVSNTADCNNTNGVCNCKTGWTGTLCELDVDECTNTSVCPDPHDRCYNLDGSSECRCDVGYNQHNTSGICEVSETICELLAQLKAACGEDRNCDLYKLYFQECYILPDPTTNHTFLILGLSLGLGLFIVITLTVVAILIKYILRKPIVKKTRTKHLVHQSTGQPEETESPMPNFRGINIPEGYDFPVSLSCENVFSEIPESLYDYPISVCSYKN